MEDGVLEEFYQNCLDSEELYYEYAELIFEALSVDPTNVSKFLCEKSINLLSSQEKDISKYISLLFIRDAILQNELQSQYIIFNSEIISFVVEALSLLEDKKNLQNLEPIIQDSQINLKFFQIMLLIFYEAKQYLKQGQIEQFDNYWQLLIQKKVPLELIKDCEFFNKQKFKKTNQVQIEEQKQTQQIEEQEIKNNTQDENFRQKIQENLDKCQNKDDENIQKLYNDLMDYKNYLSQNKPKDLDNTNIMLQQVQDIEMVYNLLKEEHINICEFKQECKKIIDPELQEQKVVKRLKNTNIITSKQDQNCLLLSENKHETKTQTSQNPNQQSSLQELTDCFENKINQIQENTNRTKETEKNKTTSKCFEPVSLNFCSQIEQPKEEQKKTDIQKSNFQIFKPQYKKIKNTQSNITLNYKSIVKKVIPIKKIDKSEIIQNQKTADRQRILSQNEKFLQEQIESQKQSIYQKEQEIQKLQNFNADLMNQLQNKQTKDVLDKKNNQTLLQKNDQETFNQIQMLKREKNELQEQNKILTQQLQIKQEILQKQMHDKSSKYQIFQNVFNKPKTQQEQSKQQDSKQIKEILQQNKEALVVKQIDWNLFLKNKSCLIMQFEEMEVYLRTLKRFENLNKPHIKLGIALKNTSGDLIYNIGFGFDPLVSEEFDIMVNKKNFSTNLDCFQQTFLTIVIYNKNIIENLPKIKIQYDIFEQDQKIFRKKELQLQIPFNMYMDFVQVDENVLDYNKINQNYTKIKFQYNEEILQNLDDLIAILPGAKIQRQLLNTVFCSFKVVVEDSKIFSCYLTINTYKNQIEIGILTDDKTSQKDIQILQNKFKELFSQLN